MIARLWHGWTAPADADAYERLLRGVIFPAIAARAIAGYRGIALWRRDDGDEVEFVTLMHFDDAAAVAEFAGAEAQAERAVVPDAARALLRRWDRRSAHYAVVTGGPS